MTHERVEQRMVNIANHGRPAISIMVWGSIWLGGRSELIIMERDPDAPKNGYTSWSYIEALELGLLPKYQASRFFQQDNAKIHVLNKTKEWFKRHGI
jgi:hypothetical protein